jgi:hypothetical protein
MRSFASGQGNDSNPCSVTLPCRTLQAAITTTMAGGEVYVLNSAGYGAVTINKAVTIIGEGAIAGVTATNGVGIMISAGANDVINLRGFDIDGGNSGSVGIQFTSGQSLNIQKSAIRGFTNSGIIFSPNAGTSALFISDTMVTNNGGNGILIAPSGAAAVNGALNRVMVRKWISLTGGRDLRLWGQQHRGYQRRYDRHSCIQQLLWHRCRFGGPHGPQFYRQQQCFWSSRRSRRDCAGWPINSYREWYRVAGLKWWIAAELRQQ